MLAIRMQRTGRKGHAEFRIIVQESRRTPTSGSIVTQLGHYNPHAKTIVLDKEKTTFYLDHGAQPSDSVVRLLQKEAIALPAWVKLATTKSRATRHPEKLRKNQPAKPAEEPTPEAASEPETTSETVTEQAVPTKEDEVSSESVEADQVNDAVEVANDETAAEASTAEPADATTKTDKE